MVLEDALGDAVLVEVQNGRRAREGLVHLPPRRTLSPQLLRRPTINVEHSRDRQFQLVEVVPHHCPQCELARGARLCYLCEGGDRGVLNFGPRGLK